MATEPREDEDEFLAFWQQHRAETDEHTTRILGVDVVVPTDLPIEVEDLAAELRDSERREDFERLLGILFGEHTFAEWKANGLTSQQLRVLVAWGFSNANGQPTTFAEAAVLVDKAEQGGGGGKAPNRAARRASSRTGASANTGRSSSRTSAASTASRRAS